MLTRALVLSLSVAGMVWADPSVVETPLGTVKGVATDLARYFWGIPFAEPPLAANRFRPAVPKKPWTGTLDATQFKAACLQPGSPRVPPSSEDCLFLQIYTPPVVSPEAQLPVFFWIHGGGFQGGSGADYNGTNLANRGMVVVTINYRMGAFGYLSSQEIKNEDPNWPSFGGMNGLNDALVALQWVRDNIRAFGGNPDLITVAGESAGALTACAMVVSPAAKGKFRNAVLESGSCIGPWGPPDTNHGLTTSTAFMESVGAKTLADLRAMPAPKLLESPLYKTFTYAVDGFLVPDLPLFIFGTGELANSHNFLIGANTLDTLYGWPWNQPGAAKTQAELKSSLIHYFGEENVPAIQQLYPSGTSDRDALGTWLEINGDICNVCPSRYLADTVTQMGRSTYLYEFGYNPGYPDPSWAGLSGHAMEISSAFESGQMLNFPYDPALAHTMSGLWAEFTKVDVPGGQPAWPVFQSGTEPFVYFDKPISFKQGYRKPQCDYWWDYSTRDINHFLNYVGFCVQQKVA